jgi:hypothetical protein
VRNIVLAALLVVVAADAAVAGDERAVLEAVIGELRADAQPRPAAAANGANWWLYDVQLKETGGRVGLTMETWRKCYGRDSMQRCEPWRGNISKLFGTDRILAGGSIRVVQPAWLWVERTGNTYTVTATYRGVDDNGNRIEAGYRFSVKSE